jgi:hypothetical protein
MHHRLKALERRLAALAAVLRAWSVDHEQEKEARERRDVLAAFLRAGLEHAGIDPNEASALRHLEPPEQLPPFLQPRPFAHPLRRLAERRRPRTLIEALDEETKRYQKGPAPNLRQASVMQLIGYYCFGEGAREAPA